MSLWQRWLVGLAVAYALASTLVFVALYAELRSEAVNAGQKLVAVFARLVAEQTDVSLQSVDQAFRAVEAGLEQASGGGRNLAGPGIDRALAAAATERPFLHAIWLTDPAGRTLASTVGSGAGRVRSDGGLHERAVRNPITGFHFGTQERLDPSRGWFVPVARIWRDRRGQVLGVVVLGVDRRCFEALLDFDSVDHGLAAALYGEDGTLLLGSRRAREGGALEGSPPELAAARALSVFPGVRVGVEQSVERAFAGPRRTMAIIVVIWLAATTVLAILVGFLLKEWRARRASDARYRLLFDANPLPTAVIDLESLHYRAVNQAMVDQYGWSRDQFIALEPGNLVTADDAPLLPAALERGDLGRTLPGRHQTRSGELIDVEVNLSQIDFDGRPALLATARDVTARNEAERLRRAAEEQLRQAQKMEAVGQLTGGVAHDFNNILMVILANADALDEEFPLEPAAREHVQGIIGATRRASDLIRQLLIFSRKQPLRPQPTDINKLVVSIGRLLRRTLGEHIVIDAILADDLWWVNIDHAQLETALVNLCINARDAMGDGGRLLIETNNVTLDEDYCAGHADVAPGPYAMVAVTDTGTGIAPEVLAKVFEPFFTTKEPGRGTGLGLSMVYGFIRQSNGHITIYSEVGSGTTVKLYLPRLGAAVETSIAPLPEALPRGVERILVIEDDDQVRESVVHQLASLGYAVTSAADGATGLAAFARALRSAEPAEGYGPYDLVITDVIMPGPTAGKAVGDEVARLSPKTPVVFMSGYTENAILRQGQMDQTVRLLTKPFGKRDLALVIRSALDARLG